MTGRRSITKELPANQKFRAGPARGPLQACVMLHGAPERCEGWVSVRMKKVSQKIHYFARLKGPLLELRETENSSPVIEVDLLGATVQQQGRQRDRATRVTLRARQLTFYFADDYQHVTWQRKLLDGSQRRIEDHYRWSENVICEGEHSTVVHAVEIATSNSVAIKVVDRQGCFASDTQTLKMLENEIDILRYISHDHVVTIWDVFETSSYLYIVLEYAPFGNLEALMQTRLFSCSEIRSLMSQLLSSLHHLHSRGFIHRDVKPENILLTRLEPLTSKIADFGFTDTFVDKELNQCVGTLPFLSPESLKRQPQTPSMDMWACGVTLYMLLFNQQPFSSDAARGPREVSRGLGVRHEPRLGQIDAEAASLVRGLLQLRPERRLSAQGALCHPFFTGPWRNERNSPKLKVIAHSALFFCRLGKIRPHSDPSSCSRRAEALNGPAGIPKKFASFHYPKNAEGTPERAELGAQVRKPRQSALLDMSNLRMSLERGDPDLMQSPLGTPEKKRPRSMQKLRKSTGRGSENVSFRKKTRRSWHLDGINARKLGDALG